MSSRSLGRDSGGRSHVITAAGASSQITRSVRRTLRREECAGSFRALLPLDNVHRPSSLSSLASSPSASSPADIPPARSLPPPLPRIHRVPQRAPFPGAHVRARTRQVFRLRQASIDLPACVQLANKLHPVVSFRVYRNERARAHTGTCRKAWDPCLTVLANRHD